MRQPPRYGETVEAFESFVDFVMDRLASELQFEARIFVDEEFPPHAVVGSTWMLLTRNQQLLDDETVRKSGHKPKANVRQVTLWTDDRTNLFEILK